jgi:hypothetical protein
LPYPGDVAAKGGYTREIALESVGDGWASLIHFLFDRIDRQRMGRQSRSETLPVRVAQVKEKFGGLRFYYDWLNHTTYESQEATAFASAAHFAETLSFYLCEKCGAFGRPGKSGWVMTLCELHAHETDGGAKS